MKAHSCFEDLLPLYAAGQLERALRAEIKNHLAGCKECQAELALWTAVSTEIAAANRALAAPPDLAARALERLHQPVKLTTALRRTGQLLRAQVFLTQRELWPSSAAVMALGVIVALISNHAEAVYLIAPLAAAASLTVLFGPANDPAYELVMATPISPWKVMLARLSIVSGYNLLLTLVAALALMVIVPPGLFGALILSWLGPMAFLSGLALLLSLWIGTGNAVLITYSLWMAQYLPAQAIDQWMSSSIWQPVILAYQQFWRHPLLLTALSAFLIVIALWSAGRPTIRLSHSIR